MRSQHSILIFILLAMSACKPSEKPLQPMTEKENLKGKFAIAIHGGAGNLKKLKLTAEQESEYLEALELALATGQNILAAGGKCEDAVEAAIKTMEDSPLFNAGKGAVFNHDGINEMDAAIMTGKDLQCGAIAGVRHIRNPISAAKVVMEKSEHVLLTSTGAEAFASSQGIEMVDSSYFFTQLRWDQLQEALREDSVELDHDGKSGKSSKLSTNDFNELKFGTVGCVALDQFGNLAAGTSTGGLTNKRYGRIGDTPLIGSGTYANNKSCAVSCTGKGEDFIRNNIAYDIAAQLEYLKIPLDSAVHHSIHEKLVQSKGRGGCIAIDGQGNICMNFTTTGMYRGYIDTNGQKKVLIYAE
jgi:L-asparaginase / beta-aspartyl-peptidase